jgi:hypothetical protein
MFGLGKKKSGKKEKKRDKKKERLLEKQKLREEEEKELQRDLSLIDDRILDEVPYRLSGDTKTLKTGIDSLYSLIKEKKNIGTSKAAKILKINEETVVEWANIMEEHEMLRIHYPVMGSPSLRSMDWKPKWKGKKEKKKEKKKGKDKATGKRIRHLKFTKKRVFIMAELIILGEVLIYIFFVNRSLSTNFLPTIIERLTFIYQYLMQNIIMLLLVIAFVGFAVFMVIGRRKMAKKKKGK